MAASDRALSRGTRRAERLLAEYGSEVFEARRSAGVSQRELGRRAAMSATKVGRLEAGRLSSLSFWDAARVAALVGLDLYVRVYPAGPQLRDAAHARRLVRLFENVRPPLIYRTEVALPQRVEGPRELRAWDAVVTNSTDGTRTAIELEMRLRDGQAVARRLAAKSRDDPIQHLLLAIADTRTNRRILADEPDLFPGLRRLKTSAVLNALRDGHHPGSGLVLV